MKTSRNVVTAGIAVAALGGAFALGTTVGNDPSSGIAGTGKTPTAAPKTVHQAGASLAAGDLALVAAGSCDDLLEWYVDNTRDQVTAWGWGGGHVMYYARDGRAGAAVEDLATNAVPPTAAGAMPEVQSRTLSKSQTSSETGTNVQEAGVDEPDVVKTNGEILVRLDGDDLTTYDVSGEAPTKISRFDLPGRTEQQPEFLLVGDRAVVLTQVWKQEGPRTIVHTVDLSDPSSPSLAGSSEYTSSLLSARQYGDTVRLVLGTGLPQLDFVTPEGKLTQREALRRNREVLAESTIGEWLPTVTDESEASSADGGEGGDSKAKQLVDCADMSRPEDFTGAGSVSIVGYSPTASGDGGPERSATGVATSSQTVYSSTDRLYLAIGSGWGGECCVAMDMPMPRGGIWPGGGDGTTQLHAFALDGDSAAYLGSGEVEGTVADRWAMDAVDGTLRVAVGPSSETGNSNSVVTLAEEDGQLVELGRVDRLGINEQIMSVRWFDDLAILVTFRQIDPLYAIDLSDPAHPKKLGELKIPGYSDYLHPIGKDRIMGLGVDADLDGRTRGGQVAVFDLADPTAPKRLGQETYRRTTQLLAGQDPRQFTWLPKQQTALTVIAHYGRSGGATGWVSVLKVAADGSLTRHNLAGTDGYDDVAALRTVPLPDGRVALVTEDSARFLAL